MIRKNSFLRNCSLTFGQDGSLPGNVRKLAQDFLVALCESVQSVRDANIVAELLDQLLRLAEVVARNPWEEVVDDLELQSAMDKVQPLGAVDVHGSAQHLLGERLAWAEVGGAHGEVRKYDLEVQGGRHHVADHDENEAGPVVGNHAIDHAVAIPGPEEDLAGKLQPTHPSGWALPRSAVGEEVVPREKVEVEASNGQDGVVSVGLSADDELGKGVVLHDPIIVGRSQVSQKPMADGEKGQVLDIRVMLWGIGDDVMNVVAPLPPAHRQTPHEVGNEDTNHGVDLEIVRDAHVARVVRGEDQLVPHETQEQSAQEVLAV